MLALLKLRKQLQLRQSGRLSSVASAQTPLGSPRSVLVRRHIKAKESICGSSNSHQNQNQDYICVSSLSKINAITAVNISINMKVLITGASGSIGGECLAQCLARPEITTVVAFVRRDLPEAVLSHPKLKCVIMKDFAQWPKETLEEHADAAGMIW